MDSSVLPQACRLCIAHISQETHNQSVLEDQKDPRESLLCNALLVISSLLVILYI